MRVYTLVAKGTPFRRRSTKDKSKWVNAVNVEYFSNDGNRPSTLAYIFEQEDAAPYVPTQLWDCEFALIQYQWFTPREIELGKPKSDELFYYTVRDISNGSVVAFHIIRYIKIIGDHYEFSVFNTAGYKADIYIRIEDFKFRSVGNSHSTLIIPA